MILEEGTQASFVLVDSSVWIEAIHPEGRTDCRNAAATLISASRAATCDVIVGEVLRGAANRQVLAELLEGLSALERLSMDGTGELAGELALRLRGKGILVPTTDLLIAATAQLHDVPLLHRDKHLSQAAEALGLREWGR